MHRPCRGLAILLVVLGLSIALLPTVRVAEASDVATVLNTPPSKDLGVTTKCASCGMKLHVKNDTPAVEYQGKDYYFRDDAERDAFAKEPDKYLKQSQQK